AGHAGDASGRARPGPGRVPDTGASGAAREWPAGEAGAAALCSRAARPRRGQAAAGDRPRRRSACGRGRARRGEGREVRRPMPTTVLLEALPDKTMIGTPPAAVAGLSADSRRVEPGDCFVAVPGFRQDARSFVRDAATRGATLVVTEGRPL